MELCPVNREWVHTYLLAPALQGTALCNRGIKGYNLYSLEKTPLSLKERVIEFLKGACLMLPLIGTIVWIAWQTFGKPEILYNPYCPEQDSVSPAPSSASRPAALPLANKQPIKSETFDHREYLDNLPPTKVGWKVECFSDEFIATQTGDLENSRSIYNREGAIQEYDCMMQSYHLHLKLCGNQIQSTLRYPNGSTKEEVFKIKEPLPWIQQSTLGLKNFILSSDQKLTFYGILPIIDGYFGAFLHFTKAIAKKIGEEEVPGYGKLLKVEIDPANLIASAFNRFTNAIGLAIKFKGILWFHPQTGQLCTFEQYSGRGSRRGELILEP